LAEQFSVDATVFYNDYDQSDRHGFREHSVSRNQNGPALFGGATPIAEFGSGYSTGFELAADWRPTQDWRLRLAYSYLYQDIKGNDASLFNTVT
jgi:outer membrane receptor protein involved in Fe transport